MTKHILRKKILVVPYVMCKYKTTYRPHFVMVKDKQTNEWGFISGGVKKHETPLQAAHREMQEESSGVLKLAIQVEAYNFVTSYRPPELLKIDQRRNEIVHSMYTMYMVNCTADDVSLLSSFVPNDEVVDIRVAPFSEFSHVWTFCDDVYHTHVEKQLFKDISLYENNVREADQGAAVISQQD
jgi:8-oxo-dGTP pyrophosphatase MutT (NUDIX family)